MIRHFLNPPNWFTMAGIVCSIYALTLLLAADTITPALLVRASMFVVLGGVCDLLDGYVARLTHRESPFGVQLDSLADVIGFGVAPALIAWGWSLHTLGHVGMIITCWFVLCAAFRLARFNVDAQEHLWPYDGHSQGLTSTMAGGSLVAFAWVCNGTFAEVLTPSPPMVAVLVAVLGFLMISSVPFRNFKDWRRNAYAKYLFAISAGVCMMAAFVWGFSIYWGLGAIIYLTWGLGDGLVVAARHRLQRSKVRFQ